MNRLIAIGLSLLVLVGFSAEAVAMSDADKQKYRAWVKEERSKAAALAVDDSGCWASSRGFGTGQAKSYALQRCASKCASKTEPSKDDFRGPLWTPFGPMSRC